MARIKTIAREDLGEFTETFDKPCEVGIAVNGQPLGAAQPAGRFDNVLDVRRNDVDLLSRGGRLDTRRDAVRVGDDLLYPSLKILQRSLLGHSLHLGRNEDRWLWDRRRPSRCLRKLFRT